MLVIKVSPMSAKKSDNQPRGLMKTRLANRQDNFCCVEAPFGGRPELRSEGLDQTTHARTTTYVRDSSQKDA